MLKPYNGNSLVISGVRRVIAAAGSSLGPGGLTPSTFYYIYALMSGVNIVLEASTTGHATEAGTGVEIKNGDNSRTLVGAVFVVAGPLFADTDASLYVLSWFNRKSKRSRTAFTADHTTTSQSFVEIGSEIRCNASSRGLTRRFIMRPRTRRLFPGQISVSAMAFDAVTANSPEPDWQSTGGGSPTVGADGFGPLAVTGYKTGLLEVGHIATLMGAVTSGSGFSSWIRGGGPIVNSVVGSPPTMTISARASRTRWRSRRSRRVSHAWPACAFRSPAGTTWDSIVGTQCPTRIVDGNATEAGWGEWNASARTLSRSVVQRPVIKPPASVYQEQRDRHKRILGGLSGGFVLLNTMPASNVDGTDGHHEFFRGIRLLQVRIREHSPYHGCDGPAAQISQDGGGTWKTSGYQQGLIRASASAFAAISAEFDLRHPNIGVYRDFRQDIQFRELRAFRILHDE